MTDHLGTLITLSQAYIADANDKDPGGLEAAITRALAKQAPAGGPVEAEHVPPELLLAGHLEKLGAMMRLCKVFADVLGPKFVVQMQYNGEVCRGGVVILYMHIGYLLR